LHSAGAERNTGLLTMFLRVSSPNSPENGKMSWLQSTNEKRGRKLFHHGQLDFFKKHSRLARHDVKNDVGGLSIMELLSLTAGYNAVHILNTVKPASSSGPVLWAPLPLNNVAQAQATFTWRLIGATSGVFRFRTSTPKL